jgi:predicted nucleotide-binding protein
MGLNEHIENLNKLADNCRSLGQELDSDPLDSIYNALLSAYESLEASWSGSFAGYHSLIYLKDFRQAGPTEHFNKEWGGIRQQNPDWTKYTFAQVQEEIDRRTEGFDRSALVARCNAASDLFTDCKREALTVIDMLAMKFGENSTFSALKNEAIEEQPCILASDFLTGTGPRELISRDQEALAGGISYPPHHQARAQLWENISRLKNCLSLSDIAFRITAVAEEALSGSSEKLAFQDNTRRVFIGHGQSLLWKELKDYIHDSLGLEWDEFNRLPVAGVSTSGRLEELLDRCGFAFLVLTGEDKDDKDELHARENVIHEAGLFQSRLGFRRAIILLEEGCNEFSNIEGLGQIRFPCGLIKAAFEDVREVLKREGFLSL